MFERRIAKIEAARPDRPPGQPDLPPCRWRPRPSRRSRSGRSCGWSASGSAASGRVWVEGPDRRADPARRHRVFLTLRDPVAAVSVRVICPRAVLRGQRSRRQPRAPGWWSGPSRTSTSTAARSRSPRIEIRAVGIGELLARLERLRRELAAEGLFAAARKRPLPFLPGMVGLICGRDSAAERDVLRERGPALARGPVPGGERRRAGAVRGGRGHRGAAAAGRRPGRRRDHHRPRRRIDRGPAAVLRRVADPRGRRHAGPRWSARSATSRTSPLLDQVADVRASTPTDAARRVVPDVSEQLELIARTAGPGPPAAGRPAGPGARPGWPASGPGRRSPPRSARSSGARSRWTALVQRARRCLCRQAGPGADDISHTRARLLALSPAARCAAATRSCSAATPPSCGPRPRSATARRSASDSPRTS